MFADNTPIHPSLSPQDHPQEKKVTIKKCARCGGDHEDLIFTELPNPSDDFTWVALCPVTAEPILMAVINKQEASIETSKNVFFHLDQDEIDEIAMWLSWAEDSTPFVETFQCLRGAQHELLKGEEEHAKATLSCLLKKAVAFNDTVRDVVEELEQGIFFSVGLYAWWHYVLAVLTVLCCLQGLWSVGSLLLSSLF